MFEQLKEKLKNIKVNGNNLTCDEEVSFDLISNYFDLEDWQIEILDYWQKYYLSIYVQSESDEIKPLDIEDGKVVIKEGQPFHTMPARLASLKNISVGGLLASEWFGILESENEASLCTFLDTIHPEIPEKQFGLYPNKEEMDYISKWNRSIQNRKAALASESSRITLYFDMENPIMKTLMSYDFFEYLKVRKNNPEKLDELYPYKLRELYEGLCDAENMNFSSKFHNDNNYQRKSWLAIPMGIPPFLINGICINSKANSELLDNLDEISELFPHATIFNENREVLRYPLSHRNVNTK